MFLSPLILSSNSLSFTLTLYSSLIPFHLHSFLILIYSFCILLSLCFTQPALLPHFVLHTYIPFSFSFTHSACLSYSLSLSLYIPLLSNLIYFVFLFHSLLLILSSSLTYIFFSFCIPLVHGRIFKQSMNLIIKLQSE